MSKRDLVDRRCVLDLDAFTLEVPFDMAWAYASGTYYERNVEHWFRRALQTLERPVVWDVGANCGFYTLLAASSGAEVVAIEPTSSTFRVLERNVERNGFDRVTSLAVALGQAEQTTTLTLFDSSGNNTVVALAPARTAHLHVTGTEEVEMTTLDALTNERAVPRPGLLKVDAEGSDYAVLLGGATTIADVRPVIFLEHGEEAHDAGYTLPDLRALLDPLGYDLRMLADPFAGGASDLTLRPLPDDEQFGTVVAIPRGSKLNA